MAQLHEWYNCCGAKLMYGISNSRPNDAEFDRLFKAKKSLGGDAAVICFIDNEQRQQFSRVVNGIYKTDPEPTNGGEEWAKFIRSKGHRVDQVYLGGNPNHQETAGHKLTLYIWYVNSQKDKESVIIGEQPKKPVFPKVTEGLERSVLGRFKRRSA